MKATASALIATLDISGWILLIVGLIMTWCKQPGPVPIFALAAGLLMVSLVSATRRLSGEETHTCMRHNILDDFSGCVLGLIVLALVVPVIYAGSIHHDKAIAVHKAAGNAVKHSVSHASKKHAGSKSRKQASNT